MKIPEQIKAVGLEQITEDSILFDCYGALLTDKQQEIFRLYHEDNLSLSEISQELGMSRQGVHEAVKKAVRSLHDYEEKLRLADKFQEQLAVLKLLMGEVEQMKKMVQSGAVESEMIKALIQMEKMISRLSEESAD